MTPMKPIRGVRVSYIAIGYYIDQSKIATVHWLMGGSNIEWIQEMWVDIVRLQFDVHLSYSWEEGK